VADALVLVGRGRYQDPWHDDAATAGEVAGVLRERGLSARLRGTFPHTLDDVGADDVALLVVAAGHGRADPDFDGDDAAWAGFHERLTGLVRAGVPVLALHQAANTFADSPAWHDLLGGRWVVGTSMHPPIGPATFRVVDREHPVTAGLHDVDAFDERYCDLDVAATSRVLLVTEHEGRDHPVVWVAGGPGRVLYDGLGHDLRSYASPARHALLRRELGWLLSGPGGASSGSGRAAGGS
jgi:uncharacterized protein